MRVVIALVVGLLAGALGGTYAYKSLSSGNEVPHAVMWMMRYHFGSIGDAIQAGQCGPDAVAAHIQTMAQVANDIDPVFLPIDDDLDGIFREHSAALREGIQQMQSAPLADCEALASARSSTFEACKACHRDFR